MEERLKYVIDQIKDIAFDSEHAYYKKLMDEFDIPKLKSTARDLRCV